MTNMGQPKMIVHFAVPKPGDRPQTGSTAGTCRMPVLASQSRRLVQSQPL